mmetsp:Transcript_18976/g.49367  ORF Transcript_18976/g.49367 Transcript_18976/m.49367 type:complete len:383 (-) Transcript_18976:77-1225(-)
MLKLTPDHAQLYGVKVLKGGCTPDSFGDLRKLVLGVGTVQRVARNANHRLAEVLTVLGNDAGILVVRDRLHDGLGTLCGVTRLKDARADKNAVAAELHHQRSIGGGSDAARGKVDHREPTQVLDLLDDRHGHTLLGRKGLELAVIHALESADLVSDGAGVPHSLNHIARPGGAFGADHRRPFVDPPHGLAKVLGAAHKRDLEVVLLDVVLVVSRGEYLTLVNVVNAKRLEDLRLDEVADPGFGHDRNGHGLHDVLNHGRIRHAGNPTVGTDVSRNALESHDSHSAGLFGNASLLGIHHIHDDATLEHLREPALHSSSTFLLLRIHDSVGGSGRHRDQGDSDPQSANLSSCVPSGLLLYSKLSTCAMKTFWNFGSGASGIATK